MTDDGILFSEFQDELRREREATLAVAQANAAKMTPKVARINAKRDVKIERIKREDSESGIWKMFFVCTTAILMAAAGCTAAVEGFGNGDGNDIEKTKQITACVNAGMEYDNETGNCEK